MIVIKKFAKLFLGLAVGALLTLSLAAGFSTTSVNAAPNDGICDPGENIEIDEPEGCVDDCSDGCVDNCPQIVFLPDLLSTITLSYDENGDLLVTSGDLYTDGWGPIQTPTSPCALGTSDITVSWSSCEIEGISTIIQSITNSGNVGALLATIPASQYAANDATDTIVVTISGGVLVSGLNVSLVDGEVSATISADDPAAVLDATCSNQDTTTTDDDAPPQPDDNDDTPITPVSQNEDDTPKPPNTSMTALVNKSIVATISGILLAGTIVSISFLRLSRQRRSSNS